MTNLASIDYSFISQFFSNASVYLMTAFGEIKQKLKDAQFEAEIPAGDLLNCLHGFEDEIEFVDNGVSSFQSCPDLDDIEEVLTQLVSNRWETGQVWGEFFANMFQGAIEAPN